MANFENMTYDDLYGVDGGSVLLTVTYIVVKASAPTIIKAGIAIAGSITAQKLLDKWFG